MKEINWDEAPEGFPIWIEASGDIGSGWHRAVGNAYEDQTGAYWSKPEAGFYTVYNKPEGNLMQNKFAIGDKVRVCVDHYGDNIPKGAILNVVADGRLGAYWISTTEVEVSMINAYSYEFTLVEAAQESNETTSLVQKTTTKNDDSSERDSQPRVDKNAWFERGELPEVGTKCIFTGMDEDVEGVIVAHVEYCGDYQAIVQCKGDWWYGEVGDFRPIKTAEEMEAEEREKVIEEMARVISSKVSDKRAAESLYELGYRKMEQYK